MDNNQGLPQPSDKHKEDAEDKFVAMVQKEYSTAGHKKFVRYLEAVLNTTEYQKLIIRWRKKYNIPPNGFSPTRDDPDWSGYVFPVFEWKVTREQDKSLRQEIKRFCVKHQLHFMDTLRLIELHLFYDQKFNSTDMLHDLGSFNLCHFADLSNEAEEPFSKDYRDSDNMAYPLAIRISPY